MKVQLTIFYMMLILLITGCSTGSNEVEEEGSINSEPQEISMKNVASDAAVNNRNTSASEAVCTNMEAIAQDIMTSKFAGYIGKTEAEIEDDYGPMLNDGVWFNGLLYAKHEKFSGSIGYENSDPGAAIESIESDSICSAVYVKLSEIMPVSDIQFNRDDLEFVCDESEGDYYYIFKNSDAPIHIDSDEDGFIQQDPLIFICSDDYLL